MTEQTEEQVTLTKPNIPFELNEDEFQHLIHLLDNHVIRNSKIQLNGKGIPSDHYIGRKFKGEDIGDEDNIEFEPNKHAFASLPLLGRMIEQFEKHCKDLDGGGLVTEGTKSIIVN